MGLIAAGRDRDAAVAISRRRPVPVATPTPSPPWRIGGPPDPVRPALGPVLGSVVANPPPPTKLDRATPCDAFDVQGVLEHMVGGATAFAAAYRGQEPTAPDLSDPLAAFGPALQDLGAAVHEDGALDRTVAASRRPAGDTFARFVVLDGLVHGWDMATATGQPYDLPAELVAEVDAFARATIDPLRDGETLRRRGRAARRRHAHRAAGRFTGRRPR